MWNYVTQRHRKCWCFPSVLTGFHRNTVERRSSTPTNPYAKEHGQEKASTWLVGRVLVLIDRRDELKIIDFFFPRAFPHRNELCFVQMNPEYHSRTDGGPRSTCALQYRVSRCQPKKKKLCILFQCDTTNTFILLSLIARKKMSQVNVWKTVYPTYVLRLCTGSWRTRLVYR